MGSEMCIRDSINTANLSSGSTISGDRKYAFAKFENDICEKSLIYMKKTNFLNINIKKKPRLVTDKSDVKNDNKHSFSDIPDKALSFINLNSVNDFEVKIKKEVNYSRFRGNLILSGIKAWEEFNWLGKIISIGDVKFEIFRKTKRCAATNVNPKTGLRDLNIPNQLKKIYGHYDLGVYGRVLNKGTIKINDEVKF